jgi:hypothetical protein
MNSILVAGKKCSHQLDPSKNVEALLRSIIYQKNLPSLTKLQKFEFRQNQTHTQFMVEGWRSLQHPTNLNFVIHCTEPDRMRLLRSV